VWSWGKVVYVEFDEGLGFGWKGSAWTRWLDLGIGLGCRRDLGCYLVVESFRESCRYL